MGRWSDVVWWSSVERQRLWENYEMIEGAWWRRRKVISQFSLYPEVVDGLPFAY
jgi:hypothetical protein